jgi:hypothetical protein
VGIDPGALPLQQLIHPALTGLVIVRGDDSAGDPRLVRHDNHWKTGAIQPANRRSGSRQQADLVWLAQKSHILDDGAVPVQIHGTAAGL